jgi:hypothetical protein
MRLPTALAAIALAALVLTATALAGTVSRSGGTLTFSAAPGETNNLTITFTQEDGSLGISDSGAPMSFDPSAGCTGDASGGGCPGAGVSLVSINLGDGDDHYVGLFPINQNLSGGDGNDTIEAGYNASPPDSKAHGTIDGGPGDDKITSTGSGFTLVGGPGNDSVFANFSDKVDCSGGGSDTIARQLGGETPKTINQALIGCGSGPKVSLTIPRITVRSLLKKGFHFSATCDRPCALFWKFQPLVGGVCHNSRCYGTGRPRQDPANPNLWTLTPGSQSLAGNVSGPSTRKATSHHRGALKVRLSLTAFDQFSAGRIVTRTFKLKH